MNDCDGTTGTVTPTTATTSNNNSSSSSNTEATHPHDDGVVVVVVGETKQQPGNDVICDTASPAPGETSSASSLESTTGTTSSPVAQVPTTVAADGNYDDAVCTTHNCTCGSDSASADTSNTSHTSSSCGSGTSDARQVSESSCCRFVNEEARYVGLLNGPTYIAVGVIPTLPITDEANSTTSSTSTSTNAMEGSTSCVTNINAEEDTGNKVQEQKENAAGDAVTISPVAPPVQTLPEQLHPQPNNAEGSKLQGDQPLGTPLEPHGEEVPVHTTEVNVLQQETQLPHKTEQEQPPSVIIPPVAVLAEPPGIQEIHSNETQHAVATPAEVAANMDPVNTTGTPVASPAPTSTASATNATGDQSRLFGTSTKFDDSEDLSYLGLYVWGRGGDGQLGHGDCADQNLPRPVVAMAGKCLVSIACGGKHTVAVTSKGDVYTWGWNCSGQLGHGNLTDQYKPLSVKGLAMAKLIDNQHFVQVAAGNDHTVALAASGAVYAWGGGQDGQLGSGTTDSETTPVPILALHSMNIVKISCGSGHTMCLTDLGRVYAWGRGSNGRLGHGEGIEVCLTPTLIVALKSIVVDSISCGFSHSMCLAANRQLYTWGKGQDGRLGHGDEKDVWVPKVVDFFRVSQIPIVKFSGGYFHSAAISLENELYTWGYGEHGQLGHGTTNNELFPKLVQGLATTKIRQVACGGAHTIAIDVFHKLHVFGSGKYGQLGVEFAPLRQHQKPLATSSSSTPDTLRSSRQLIDHLKQASEEEVLLANEVHKTLRRHQSQTATTPNRPDSATATTPKSPKPNSSVIPSSGSMLVRSTSTSSSLASSSPVVQKSSSTPLSPTNSPIQSPSTSTLSTSTLEQLDGPEFPQRPAAPAPAPPSSTPDTSLPVTPSQVSAEPSLDSVTPVNPPICRVPSSPSLTRQWSSPQTPTLPPAEVKARSLKPMLVTALETRRPYIIACGYWHSLAVVHPDAYTFQLPDTMTLQSGIFSTRTRRVTQRTTSIAPRPVSTAPKPSPTKPIETSKSEKFEAQWTKLLQTPWEKLVNTDKFKRMCKQGIPRRFRGAVWRNSIGNKAGMSPKLYQIFFRHAQEDMFKSGTSGETVRLIEVDLPRTFPEQKLFNNTGPFCQPLLYVLASFAQCRPDVGYVQGMSNVAGMLILHMEAYEAFESLVSLITSSGFFMNLYKMDFDRILKHIRLFNLVFNENLPQLYRHFAAEDISPNFFLLEWFITLFTRVLPLSHASRVWDCLFWSGEEFVHQVALGILKIHQKMLLSLSFEELAVSLHHLPKDFSEETLMTSVYSIQISPTAKELAGILKRVP
ncbi:E3 ubiquitin-protein ligase HERC2 [Pelomyxa schiedti]|nr:E3 ubiquitin-protein ligase HERC2 [Pelomyxa schiedti]